MPGTPTDSTACTASDGVSSEIRLRHAYVCPTAKAMGVIQAGTTHKLVLVKHDREALQHVDAVIKPQIDCTCAILPSTLASLCMYV